MHARRYEYILVSLTLSTCTRVIVVIQYMAVCLSVTVLPVAYHIYSVNTRQFQRMYYVDFPESVLFKSSVDIC